MKILIVEDSIEKFEEIRTVITDYFDWCSIEFHCAGSVHEYCKVINSQKFDLIILDILLPRRSGEDAIDVSNELMREREDTLNQESFAVALTAMASPEYDTLLCFNECSVPVLMYGHSDSAWKPQLSKIVNGLSDVSMLDFAICCALEKEADAFEATDATLKPWKSDLGALRWRPIQVGDQKGAVFVFPQMGVTQSALYTSRVLEAFQPKVVAMSGICAGLKDECNLVDIVVATMAWDHQVGKMTDEGFKQEINLENVDPDVIGRLKHIQKTRPTTFNLPANGEHSTKNYSPKLVFGPVASGSVVVASSKEIARIEAQQRKVVGVEMEIAAFLAACSYSRVKPKAFAAKSVVDFADADKDDDVHSIASVASAQYIVSVLPDICRM
ncbi:hypothetical protein O4H61_17060 [Roseovarius aestuarii]|nr:hypothetical protein [Roseovarius aestuarii]